MILLTNYFVLFSVAVTRGTSIMSLSILWYELRNIDSTLVILGWNRLFIHRNMMVMIEFCAQFLVREFKIWGCGIFINIWGMKLFLGDLGSVNLLGGFQALWVLIGYISMLFLANCRVRLIGGIIMNITHLILKLVLLDLRIRESL